MARTSRRVRATVELQPEAGSVAPAPLVWGSLSPHIMNIAGFASGTTAPLETRSRNKRIGGERDEDPYEVIRQRREEMAREVKQNRLAGELRRSRRRRAGDSDRALWP